MGIYVRDPLIYTLTGVNFYMYMIKESSEMETQMETQTEVNCITWISPPRIIEQEQDDCTCGELSRDLSRTALNRENACRCSSFNLKNFAERSETKLGASLATNTVSFRIIHVE